MEQPANRAQPEARKIVTRAFDLVEPILREGSSIDRLTLRKPRAGEMRGLSLDALLSGEVNAVIALLPRIADPFITEAEAADLCAEDIAEAGGTIRLFFMGQATLDKIAEMNGIASPSMT